MPVLESGLTVEEDEEEVADSLTAVSPVIRVGPLSALCINCLWNLLHVTGGRLGFGLVPLALDGAFAGVGTPGD